MLSALLALALGVAPPAAPSTSPQELELLLQSVQPAQRPVVQASVRGLGALPLYRVVVRVDSATRAFHGEEQIRAPVSAVTRELALRLYDDARYVNGGAPAIHVGAVSCPDQQCAIQADADPTLYRVTFDPPLPAGSVAAIDLPFDGEVPELPAEALSAQAQLSAQMTMLHSRGGGPTDHGAFGAGEGVLALTGLFPQLAAHFAGGVDVSPPTGIGDVASYDLSNYLVTVEVPANTTVVGAGAKIGEEATPEGGKRYSFAAAAVRDFPLYAGTAWRETTQKAGPVTVTAYTLPGDEASGKIALGIAVRALEDFSKRFGPYPWIDLRVVEQPLTDDAGGIEYPTVIGVATMLYRTQQSLGPMGALFGPKQVPGSHDPNVGLADKMLELGVAHEVAHQWWAIMVGSDPHLHPAVDESLAQYSAVLYIEGRRGKAAAKEAQKSQLEMGYQMMRQAGEPDGEVDRATDAYSSPLQYAGLVYGKGPLFYAACRKLLGEKTFDEAARRYFQKHRFGEAGPDDFVLAAAEVSPGSARKLEKLHRRWFEQRHGDEDIGPMDMGALIESATGMQMSPEEKAAMQQLMPQLMQMLQSGVDPSTLLGGQLPGAPSAPSPQPRPRKQAPAPPPPDDDPGP